MAKSKSTSLKLDDTTLSLSKRIWRSYLKDQIWLIAAAVFFMAIVAGSVGLQVKLVEPAFDEILVTGDDFWIWAAPLGFFLAAVIAGCSNFAQSYLMHRVGLKVVERIQNQMFSSILQADLLQIQSEGTSRQLSRFTTDMNFLREMVIKAFTGIGRDVLKIIVLSSLMFYQNWQMSLLAVVFFPISVIPVMRIGRRLRKISTSNQANQGQMTSVVDDALKGVRQVKSYNMYAYEEKRAGSAFRTIFKLVLKGAQTRALSYPILDTLAGSTLALVLFWGGLQVQAGETTVGGFMSFFTAIIMAYQPARGLANMNATLQEGLAAAKRAFDVIDNQPKIVNQPEATDLSITDGAIRLDSVRFEYEGDQPVLDGVTIEAKAGQTIALVGPSGGGKSTILNLIPRFYDVVSGEIRIDDRDTKTVTLESLRRQIGLVTQETLLFNDTVRANIAYGLEGASDDDVIAAAKAAAAHDFISALPEGYDTQVGEHGLKLSGGQRQRISIARAMLKNAPILLLDEATSALDTQSERQVQAALETLMQGRTSIVIAHRLSTVRHADVIYVLDKGRVVEQGNHDGLVAQNGLYAKLSSLQFNQEAGAGEISSAALQETVVEG